MNQIHKVIWSRCSNAFVVVSELARSRSAGSSTRSGSSVDRLAPLSPLTALAAGVALAFGLSASAFADIVPGGSVVTVAPGDSDLSGAVVENTAYGNALLVTEGIGIFTIDGGSFTVSPTPPNEQRNGDNNPYAAIKVNAIEDDQLFLKNGVEVNVQGDNLHGIYLAESYSWLSSDGTKITATGKDITGMYVAGTANILNGDTNVSGDNAKGLSIVGGSGNILSGTVIKVSGDENIIGIDVQNGNLNVAAVGLGQTLDLTVTGSGAGADANVTGIQFSGIDTQGKVNNSQIIVNNSTGNYTTGVLINDIAENQRINIADTTIVVDGSADLARTNGIKVEGSNEGMGIDLAKVTLTVTGHAASGVLIDSAKTDVNVDDTTINVNLGSTFVNSSGIRAIGSASEVTVTNSFLNVAGDSSEGISLYDNVGNAPVTGTIKNTKITVDGDGSWGVIVGASHLTISDTTINLTGKNTTGIMLDASTLVSNDNTLEFTGTHANGLDLSNNAIATVSDTTITMQAMQSTGVKVFGESTSTISGSALSGAGIGSRGVHAAEKSTASITGTTINLVGDSSYGVQAYDDDTTVSLDNATVDVQGDRSFGLHLSDRATADITGGTTIDVRGEMGRGIELASGASLSTNDATITVDANTVNGSAYGITSNGSAAVLANTRISAVGEATAHGVEAFSSSMLNTSNDTRITAKSNGNAKGVYADAANVTLANTMIDVEGNVASGIVSGESNLTVSASSIVVKGSGGSTTGGSSQKSNVSLTGSQVTVDGVGTGWVSTDDAAFVLSNSTIGIANGSNTAHALNVQGSKDVKISNNSLLSATGSGANSDVRALDVAQGGVNITDSRLSAVGSHTNAAVIGIEMREADVTLARSTVEASGTGAQTGAVYMTGGGTALKASGQTRLISSQHAIVLDSISGSMQASLTDTELVAGATTFSSFMGGDAMHRINLGKGVVATTNDGMLLRVERAAGIPTGRVELNIADGAKLTGAIHDTASGLADLTANGGTYLSLNNADYSGVVQNIRSVSLANKARIGGGTLAAPNTVLEEVSVDNATLAGNWQIAGALSARNGGRVAPGNSIGVITADSINWGPGTILEVEVNAAGESDRVEVTGAAPANIGNTALHVTQEDGTGGYRLDHNYTILNAAGGVSGEFTEASWQGGELIRINPTYGPNQIGMSLSVNQQALAAANLTPNQRAASDGALSVAGINLAADAAFLSANPAASFDLLSGEIHPSTRAGLMNSSTLLSNAILGRLRDRSSAPTGFDTGAQAAATQTQYPLWVSYTHNQQTAKGDNNTARRKHTIDSFALGGDAQVGADWKVGGAFAYTNSDIKLNERRSSSDIDSYSLALYTGKSWETSSGALNLMAGLGHTWHDVSTHRNVDLGGLQPLKASYDARTLQLFGELGYAMPLGERSTVEPYLGVTWLQHRTDGFSESGGPAALKGASGTDDVTFSTLGLRAGTTVEAGKTALRLNAGLGWRHAFGDQQPGARLSFIQGSSNAFTVVGAPIARNTAVFNLGTEVQVGRHTAIGLGYEGQAGSGFSEHAGNLYLKTRF